MHFTPKFCIYCGKETIIKFLDGRDRIVCEHCKSIHYTNPKLIVGALCIWQDKVLLCRRAIEPRKGYWNIPAGFLEDYELTELGAMREVWEEAGAEARILQPYVVYNLPQANQVYIHFLAELTDGNLRNGEESIESMLFAEKDIPWKEMAFTSSSFALRHYFKDRQSGKFSIHLGTFPESE